MWQITSSSFSVDQFIPRCHNEGTSDIIKKKIILIPHEEDLPCAKFQFLKWSGFRDRGPKFFLFSNMAATPHNLWRNYQNILHESAHVRRKLCQADKQLQRKLARTDGRMYIQTTRKHASVDFVSRGIKRELETNLLSLRFNRNS